MPSGGGGLTYRMLGTPRFALALLVVHWHVLPVATVDTAFLAASRFGPIAVFLFFVLSGFSVTEAALAFYRGRPWAFLGNRLLRLWPAYLVALALLAALMAAGAGGEGHTLGAANLLANAVALFPTVVVTDPLLGLARRDELLVVVWALRVEFLFYGLVAAVLLAGRLRVFARVPLASLLWAALLAGLAAYHLWDLHPRATLYGGMAPYFVLGASGALHRHGRLPPSQAVALLAASGLLCLLHALSFNAADADASGWGYRLTAGSWAGALLWALLLFWCQRRLARARATGETRDRFLGAISYELYLIHMPVIAALLWIWPHPQWIALLLVPLLSAAAATAFSAVMGRLLRPLRRRLRSAPPP